jgi:hypothetical protein
MGAAPCIAASGFRDARAILETASKPNPCRPLIRLRTALLVVLLVGATLRIPATYSLTLIIQNDSVEYLRTAWDIAHGVPPAFRPDRTPGYPLLLAGIFATLGCSPVILLAVQHALGLGACLLLTWATAARSSALAGMIAGLLAALDPWTLTFESYAMTELPSAVVLIAIAATMLVPIRRPLLRSALLGLLLAVACLIRPTFQVLAPFCIVGLALAATRTWKPTLAAAACSLAVLALGLLPWLLIQRATHGQVRLALGNGAHFFSGVGRMGLLDEQYPLPPDIRAAYQPFAGKPLGDVEFWTFQWKVDGLGRSEGVLRDWALASIRARPREYARCVMHAVLNQLNYAMESSPINWPELAEMAERVGEEGSGVQYDPSGPQPVLDKLQHETYGGFLHGPLRYVSRRIPRGVPQIPLAFCALVVCAIAALRRDAALVGLLLGTFAFLAAHALFLFPNGRYQFPTWLLWYMTPALLAQWTVVWLRRRRRLVAAAVLTEAT